MRRELMDVLVCPMCKGELKLIIKKEKESEIISGSLHCVRCNDTYPIEDSIPNLLPKELRQAS